MDRGKRVVALAIVTAIIGCGGNNGGDGGGGGNDLGSGGGGGDGGGGGGGSDGGGGGDMAPGGGLVDCAQASNRASDPRCGGIADAIIGKGIQLAHQNLFGSPIPGGGFVDGNRLVVAVDIEYGNPNLYGVIVAVDLQSGDRTVVSGKWHDPSTGDDGKGDGTPALIGVHDVQKTPDGHWWASVSTERALGSAPRYLVEVDPQSGHRSQVWTDGGNGLRCTNPSTNKPTTTKYTFDSSSIAIDADGGVYYSVQGNPGSAGNAVVRLAPKAGTCTLVTASQATAAGDNRGSGPVNFVGLKGMKLDGNGFLWGVEGETESLWKVDVATGNRTRVSCSGASMVGSGSNQLGGYGLALPLAAGDKLWTVGNVTGDDQSEGAFTAVDDNGDRSGPTAADIYGPASGSANAVWHYPGKGWLILSGPDFSIVLFDPQTNNSNYLSKS